MIEFKEVRKTFEDGFQALKNINLNILEGELITLIGPSGCGKTTTMRMINRLLDPTQGEIFIRGENIKDKNPVQLRRDIGYVIQQIGLLPHMTIADNIAVVPRLKKWKKDKYMQRVDELLDLVGLDPSTFKERYPSELSGGQQQRVGVIRALAADPPIILMDEPFSALDPISREQLQDELIKLQDEIQKTIVFVTHDMDEAIKIANRIALMREGEIVQVDTPERILRYPKDDFVRDFIGSKRLRQELGQPVAEEFMLTKVITVFARRGLAEAFSLMRKNKVDQLYITGKDREMLGWVSLEEVKNHYRDESKNVADIMHMDVRRVSPESPVSEVADHFTDPALSTLPVVSDGRLVGLITRSSMIRGIAEWEQEGGSDDE